MAVLIVDDVRLNRLTLAKALEPRPVLHAGDASEALELFFTQRPEVVLLDLGLPIVDGVGILKVIRLADERRKGHTPVIIVSGQGTSERVRQAIDLGVEGFLVKPVDATSLCTKVEALLSQAGP